MIYSSNNCNQVCRISACVFLHCALWVSRLWIITETSSQNRKEVQNKLSFQHENFSDTHTLSRVFTCVGVFKYLKIFQNTLKKYKIIASTSKHFEVTEVFETTLNYLQEFWIISEYVDVLWSTLNYIDGVKRQFSPTCKNFKISQRKLEHGRSSYRWDENDDAVRTTTRKFEMPELPRAHLTYIAHPPRARRWILNGPESLVQKLCRHLSHFCVITVPRDTLQYVDNDDEPSSESE